MRHNDVGRGTMGYANQAPTLNSSPPSINALDAGVVFRFGTRTVGFVAVGGRDGASQAKSSGELFADHAVSVRVTHERIGRMAPRHGCDVVAPRLLAGNAAIVVVVPVIEGIGFVGWRLAR